MGYVQGMNFIAGALLIHCDESATFWLMTVLFDQYQLREVYAEGLIGMYRHCYILDELLAKYLPKIHSHF